MSCSIDREETVYYTKLAEQAERYDEMVDSIKHLAFLHTELTSEERNLLSVAYKNLIGSRRAAWRIISSIAQKEQSKENEHNLQLIIPYLSKIEREIISIISDILEILTTHLIPFASTSESRIFYYKMKGDYYRYLAEISKDEARKNAASKSQLEGYEKAMDVCNEELPPTDPIRLGLSLSWSVFYYEILNETATAVEIAKKAFDGAIGRLDDLDEDSYKDCTVITQLLKNNLDNWTKNDEETE